AEVLHERLQARIVFFVANLAIVVARNAENDAVDTRCRMEPSHVGPVEIVRIETTFVGTVDDVAEMEEKRGSFLRSRRLKVAGHRIHHVRLRSVDPLAGVACGEEFDAPGLLDGINFGLPDELRQFDKPVATRLREREQLVFSGRGSGRLWVDATRK